MRRVLVLFLLLAATSTQAAKRAKVGDALCVSWSAPPLLALPPEGREAYLTALGDAGWRLVRTDFTWSAIEPTPGQRNFDAYDNLVTRAAAHGVRVVGILDYGNPWAAGAAPPGDDRYPPDDPKTFARFAKAAARRYRGRVPAWEMWNEPNDAFGNFWKPMPDPARYAELAALAARAVRRTDQKAKIVTGGLAPTFDILTYGKDWGFLSAAVAARPTLLRSFNAAALHPYTLLQKPPPEDDSSVVGLSVAHQIADFRERLREAQSPTLPIWATELGWHTAPDSGNPTFPGVSELDQARYLVRGTTLALGAGAARVCWYTVTDFPNAAHDKEAAFGLFRYNAGAPADFLDPKPAFTAAATFAHVLATTKLVGDLRDQLSLPPEAYGFAFRDKKAHRTIWVFWATRDGVVVQAPVDFPVHDAHIVDMTGIDTDLGRPGNLTLTLGQDPFYLVLEEGAS